MDKSASRTHSEKQPWWRSLRILAIGWTIVPLTLMLILAISATAVVLQATVKQLAESYSQEQVQLTANRISNKLNIYQQTFQVISQNTSLLQLTPAENEAYFSQFHHLLDDFVVDGGIFVLDANGIVRQTYPLQPELLGQNYNQPPYNEYLKTEPRSPTFFNINTEPNTTRQVVGLSAPLLNQEGRFSGLVVGQFHLDQQRFSHFFHRWQMDNGRAVYLVDQQDQVIFHTDPAQLGQNYHNREAVTLLRANGQANAFTGQNSNGIRTIFTHATIADKQWGLVLSTPWDQVFQPIQRSIWFIVSVLILGLCGSLLVLFWGVSRIGDPLKQLITLSRQVAAGNYQSRAEPSRIIEIHDLGMAFNHMVSQLDSYRSGLQEYVAAITDTQEEERKRIARDLHDGTVQSLIAIGQRLELSRDTLGEISTTESKAQLSELRHMVTETIASVRQFSRDLRPLALEDLGLIPALQFLINRITQGDDIQAHLEIEGEAIGLNPDLETTIYRLVQEALSNIHKHAQATQVRIVVRFLPRQTVLEVHDNGIGFAVPQNTTDLAHNGSFGLLGMEERASLFGGDLFLQSAPNQGSIIRVILPHKQLPRRIGEVPTT